MEDEADIRVDLSQVIRLILQFLREQGLLRSLEALQDETHVAYCTLAGGARDALAADVRHGRWEAVLGTLAPLRLPAAALAALFDAVVVDLLEKGDRAGARELLWKAAPLQALARDRPERYRALEHLASLAVFDPAEAYGGASRDASRSALASALLAELDRAPPGRLLSLLSQAVKWQVWTNRAQPGAEVDLFAAGPGADGAAADGAAADVAADAIASRASGAPLPLADAAGANTTAAAFALDPRSLVLGSSDGFLEVWDHAAGALRLDLEYQRDDQLMMHAAAVSCVAASREPGIVAAGCADGAVKVWNVARGACLLRVAAAHAHAVTALQFSPGGGELLAASADGSLRVFGLQSGAALLHLVGHAAAVRAACYDAAGGRVLSGAADGELRVWDVRSAACVFVAAPVAGCAVRRIVRLPGTDWFAVATASPLLVVVDARAVPQFVLENVATQQQPSGLAAAASGGGAALPPASFVDCAVSPRGRYIYAIAEDGVVHVYSTVTRLEERSFQALARGTVVGVAAHALRNAVVTFGSDGTVRTWRA